MRVRMPVAHVSACWRRMRQVLAGALLTDIVRASQQEEASYNRSPHTP
jgi:hypothetical protein